MYGCMYGVGCVWGVSGWIVCGLCLGCEWVGYEWIRMCICVDVGVVWYQFATPTNRCVRVQHYTSINIIHVYVQWVLVEVLVGCYFRGAFQPTIL